METILYVILGVALGFAIVYVWLSGRLSHARQELAVKQSQLESERQNAQKQLEQERQNAQNQLESERENAKKQLEQERENARQKLSDALTHAEEMREEMRKQQEAKNRLVQEEIRNMATQMLKESKSELNKENRERLDDLLNPLRERMEAFQKAVSDNSKEGVQNKTEIKTAFEEAMKKLHDEQERTVRELKEQTERIGNDAASLTQALKGDSKTQGDWGEMILDKTLEDCGLIKDEQYLLQQTYKDENGNIFRPDAVIQFPNSETAVIDSKVSLTAYQEAVRAEDPAERDRWLREHVQSVKAHINELADKNYDRLVPNCIGYVMMFIPYESGYSAAIKTDPSLLQYAYKRHIIMLSPSNLLMALQLIHTMWQNFRMNKNVEEILRQSNDLYDKFVTFAETFVKIETDIQRIQKDFDTAKGQLNEGKGNIVRRLDNLKTLGITPKKHIPMN
ncbi:MAG: DNA recombination protein RmuC [Prevotella sp.]|nr:DNA recombination protein RmuC [Prevotella sp.]